MNYDIMQTSGKIVKSWTRGVDFDDASKEQVRKIAEMPFIHHHVAIMPDVHLGKGATIGSVIPTKNAIIPAAVGVDLNCGMIAVKTNLKASHLPDNLYNIRLAIEEAVPHGRSNNGQKGDIGAWEETPESSIKAWNDNVRDNYKLLLEKHPKAKAFNDVNHLGTLGTGNHFVELCLDEHQDVWIMLHSGSRGFGNSMANYFIELAKKDMQKWFINLPDKDLSYLVDGTEHFNDYIFALDIASTFASLNRKIMLENVIVALKKFFPEIDISEKAINCHHNYVSRENHFGENVFLTRKGAVSAKKDELGIIPGSMGARSFIVRGRGNKESFCSCSHGAGRIMSRTEAKKMVSIDEHIATTKGVECRKDESVLDETPKAYKDIDAVMNAQSDLVEIVYTLKQVVCVKG